MAGTTLAVVIAAAAVALIAAGALGWLLGAGRARAAGVRELAAAQRELAAVQRAAAVAETQRQELASRLTEQRALLDSAEARLSDTFRALAAEALQANTEGFFTLAAENMASARRETELAFEARQQAIEGLVKPVKESLDKVDGKIQELERARGQAYGSLIQQVKGLMAGQERLAAETGSLARALRSPNVRGRWGEIQLRRVVELAGMVEHCDFSQQVTLVGEEGRLRPDLVVRLPGGRQVIVDAKVPLEAYLRAMEATSEEERRAHLREHAGQLRAHLQRLGSKAYWAELAGTPEFVVMFLPGETIFGAALEEAPTLIEDGVGRRVLLATPTTLIALLQTVHYGWRQERLAESAEKISEQGRLLHERVATLLEHWVRLGNALGKATEHFNAAAASFEGRLVPAARRLEELGAGSKKEAPELPRLDLRPRLVSSLGDVP
jgi:DNA recombination protein RmuC